MTVVTQILMQAPGTKAHTFKTQRGVTYVAVLGTPTPMPVFDAAIAEANGWVRCGDGYGTTANRPTVGLFVGFKYNDSTLSETVIWDGAKWRHAVTGTAD